MQALISQTKRCEEYQAQMRKGTGCGRPVTLLCLVFGILALVGNNDGWVNPLTIPYIHGNRIAFVTLFLITALVLDLIESGHNIRIDVVTACLSAKIIVDIISTCLINNIQIDAGRLISTEIGLIAYFASSKYENWKVKFDSSISSILGSPRVPASTCLSYRRI